MKINSLKKTFRNTRRLAEIFSTFTKFGFQQVLIDSGLYRFFDLKKEEEPEKLSDLPKAVRIRMAFEELGPTFIKLGQLLATRPDLIPLEWTEELKKLQARCSSLPFTSIEEVLVTEFAGRKDDLFAFIEQEPLATASMAQVHRATFRSGENVVIKVLRPGSRQIIEEDMALLQYLAQIVEHYFSNLGYSPLLVAQEFSREILKEVNLIYEAQATEKLRKYFEDDDNISFPQVYWETTTRSVLTLEEINGQLLSTVSPETLSSHDRRQIVSRGTDAVFKQCLQFGFFHADPHPGNIFLLPSNKLCFIDCGMTGKLDKKTTDLLIDLVASVIRGNVDKLGKVVIELTDADPAIVEKRDFRTELQHLADQVRDTSLEQIDISRLLRDFFKTLQKFKILCPSELLLLAKALTEIESVAEEIDPSFDVLSHVEPQIRRLISSRYSFQAIRNRFFKSAANYMELLEAAPHEIQRLVEQMRKNSFTMNLDVKRIEHLAHKIDHASRLMGIAMIIASLVVSSSILILADSLTKEHGMLQTMGIIGLGFGVTYSIGFVISFLLPRRKK